MVTYLEVVHAKYDTHEPDPERENDWDNTWEYDIDGFLVKEGERSYYDFVLPREVKSGDTLYMVSVIYSTGDSFHYETGCREFVEVFDTYEEAVALQKQIEQNEKDYAEDCRNEHVKGYKRKAQPITFLRNGESVTITAGSWQSYFGGMDYVDVDSYTVYASKEEIPSRGYTRY